MNLNKHSVDFDKKSKQIFLDQVPLVSLSTGGYRLIAATADKKYVIKLDHIVHSSLMTHTQTANEIDQYEKIDKPDLKFFPTLVSHGQVNKNKKIFPFAVYKYINLNYDVLIDDYSYSKMHYLINKYGFDDICVGRVGSKVGKYANWAMKTPKTPIIYDFGC